MILTLEITGPQGAKLGSEGRKLFRATGGTIGRLADNDWVLGDRYVSSVHARVHYSAGVFRIEDAGSTNGVYVNSTKLVPGQPQVVRTGDLILIEPYEIRATIGPAVAEPAPYTHDPFGPTSGAAPAGGLLDDLFAPAAPPRAPGPAWPAPPDQFAPPDSDLIPGDRSPVLDPIDALGLADEPSRPRARQAADLQHRSVEHDHYRPPQVVPAAPVDPKSPPLLIPDDYDPLRADSGSFRIPTPASERPQRRSVAPTPSPAPRPHVPAPSPPASVPRPAPHSVSAPSRTAAPDPAPTPSAAPGPTLAEVLAAAGLRDVPVTDELAQDFGRILRVVVEGVIELLRSRQQLKEEFRLGMTTFARADNNPLKFSANADHALQMLLAARGATFLPPVAAFEEAFRDIRDHQLAMLEGMRAGFEKMLQEFEPGRLQEEFDRQSKSALVAKPAKMRYWELYCVRIHDMVRDADATFRKLFGDDFANAYEEQARRLKSHNRSGQTQERAGPLEP